MADETQFTYGTKHAEFPLEIKVGDLLEYREWSETRNKKQDRNVLQCELILILSFENEYLHNTYKNTHDSPDFISNDLVRFMCFERDLPYEAWDEAPYTQMPEQMYTDLGVITCFTSNNYRFISRLKS